jgi:hypothetical protein
MKGVFKSFRIQEIIIYIGRFHTCRWPKLIWCRQVSKKRRNCLFLKHKLGIYITKKQYCTSRKPIVMDALLSIHLFSPASQVVAATHVGALPLTLALTYPLSFPSRRVDRPWAIWRGNEGEWASCWRKALSTIGQREETRGEQVYYIEEEIGVTAAWREEVWRAARERGEWWWWRAAMESAASLIRSGLQRTDRCAPVFFSTHCFMGRLGPKLSIWSPSRLVLCLSVWFTLLFFVGCGIYHLCRLVQATIALLGHESIRAYPRKVEWK